MHPTEERLAQKMKAKRDKLAGKKAKKKSQTVEQHFDDCGSDLSGLDVATLSAEPLWSKEQMEDENRHDPHCDVQQTLDGVDLMDVCDLSHPQGGE